MRARGRGAAGGSPRAPRSPVRFSDGTSIFNVFVINMYVKLNNFLHRDLRFDIYVWYETPGGAPPHFSIECRERDKTHTGAGPRPCGVVVQRTCFGDSAEFTSWPPWRGEDET